MRKYTEIISVLEEYFSKKSRRSIEEIVDHCVSLNYGSKEVIALIKFLISYDKIHINDSEDKKFIDYFVSWNEKKELQDLPSPKETNFEIAELCISLPPFDQFGLTDFFKERNLNLKPLINEFSSLFSSARKTIRICSPFLEWDGFQFFQDILLSKARDNIKIKILSRQIGHSEHNTRFHAIKKIYELFRSSNLENNLFIRNYYYLTEKKRLASSIHAKLILIDNVRAYIGSGEIRKNSFEKNFELGMILSGERVKELSIIFDGIFSKSEVIQFD